MSLTNDMLLNLEKKRHGEHAVGSILENITASKPSNTGYYISFVLYGLVIATLLISLLMLFHFNMRHDKSTMPVAHSLVIPPAVITIKPIAAPKKVAPLQPVLLKTPIKESTENILNTHYQEAILLVEQNQYKPAIKKLKNILLIDPTYKNARLALGTLYLKTNQLHHAIRILADGLAFNPHSVSLTLLYVHALIMAHHNADALRALKGIAGDAANNPSYIALLASVQESLQNYSEAISLYQTLLQQDPANTRWLISLGITYEKNHQNHAALRAFKKAQSTGQLSLDLQNYVSGRIQYLSG